MSGSPRKTPGTRARTNPEARAFRLIEAVTAPQPSLPVSFGYQGHQIKFSKHTQKWWEMWGRSPLTQGFTENDWAELTDAAICHSRVWLGLDLRASAELRQRTAKFGATPEDRARLRILFVSAEDAEEKHAFAKRENARIPGLENLGKNRLTAI